MKAVTCIGSAEPWRVQLRYGKRQDRKMTKPDGAKSIEALHDRRRWISTVSRWTLLAGITGIAGLLTVRKWSRGCTESASACPRCQLLGQCQLPQARSSRGPSQEERVNG